MDGNQHIIAERGQVFHAQITNQNPPETCSWRLITHITKVPWQLLQTCTSLFMLRYNGWMYSRQCAKQLNGAVNSQDLNTPANYGFCS